jgi:hypothetical protein
MELIVFPLTWPCERQQVAQDMVQVLGLFGRDLHQSRVGSRARVLVQHLDAVDDGGERVADFVGDARRQSSEVRESFCLLHLVSPPACLRDVADEGQDAAHAPRRRTQQGTILGHQTDDLSLAILQSVLDGAWGLAGEQSAEVLPQTLAVLWMDKREGPRGRAIHVLRVETEQRGHRRVDIDNPSVAIDLEDEIQRGLDEIAELPF